jgi:Holliday junction resolvase RusA-like endonuclease
MLIIIEGDPIPWKAHAGYGRKSFNPLYKEREMVRYFVKMQEDFQRLEGAICLSFDFFFKIPKATSKIRTIAMINGSLRPLTRPDASNCIKFYEDCLKDLLFDDDSQVVEIKARKFYSDKPKTVIKVSNI